MSNPTELPATWQKMQDDDNEQWTASVYMQQEIAQLRALVVALLAQPEGEAPEPVRLRIGVSNNTDGVHMVVLRKRANGDTNIVMQSRIPEGDSYNHIVLLD